MNWLVTVVCVVVGAAIGGVVGFFLRDNLLLGLVGGAGFGLAIAFALPSIIHPPWTDNAVEEDPNVDDSGNLRRLAIADLPEEVRDVVEMMGAVETDAEENVEILQEIADAFPGCVEVRLNLGVWQLEAGNVDGAERTHRAVLSDFPDEKGAIAGLASVFLARHDYSNAEAKAREAIASGYHWPTCHSVIAKCREVAGDVDAAAEAYLKAYRMHPHGWGNLKSYCRLKKRPYRTPLDDVPRLINDDQLRDLYSYINESSHSASEGCDHTLRFTTQWAEEKGIDVIDLYQFLNANGGFCDCEVCFNVETIDGDGCNVKGE